MPYPIVVINESTAQSDATVESWIAPLQVQVSQHFAPIWGTDAELSFNPRSVTPPPAAWQLVVFDNSDQANALGYHDVTAQGLPLGNVFAESDLKAGSSVSVTASHELLEMLGDPLIDTTIMFQDSTGAHMALFMFEACDACEADEYGYEISGLLVSDFVYPSWFGQRPNPPGVNAAQLDHQGKAHKALSLADPKGALLPGGYIGMWTPTNGWGQVNGQQRESDPWATPQRGSRRERRMRRGHWLPSLPPKEIAKRRADA